MSGRFPHPEVIVGRTALALAACPVLFASRPAAARCPDGSPPPCAIVRQSAPAVPSEVERGRRFLILPFRNLTRTSDGATLAEA
jgi:hypothetical protein